MPNPFGGPPPAYVKDHLPFTGEVEVYRVERVSQDEASHVRGAFTGGASPKDVPVREVRIRAWAEAVAEAVVDDKHYLLVSFPPKEMEEKLEAELDQLLRGQLSDGGSS